MEIRSFPKIADNTNQSKLNSKFQKLNNDIDTYNFSQKNNSNVSFGKSIFSLISSIFASENVQQPESSSNCQLNNLAKNIAKDYTNVFDNPLPPENFACIMSAEELKEILPRLTEENFLCKSNNQENGIYSIDIDYQSNFSSGIESINDIMNNVAEYSDEYYNRTGKDFIFALTEKDCIASIQVAINIIANNPEKFKHVKFVPGIKLAFSHKAPNSGIGYENTNMLVYGINPFSTRVIDMVDDTLKRRKRSTFQFIQDLIELYPDLGYNVDEFHKINGLDKKTEYTKSNIIWRLYEYAISKGGTSISGEEANINDILIETNKILSHMDDLHKMKSKEKNRNENNSTQNSTFNKTVKEIFEKYLPHEVNGLLVSPAENTFDNIIKTFYKEKEKPIMAISSPFYLSHHFEKENATEFPAVVEFLKNLVSDSFGMLVAFESIDPLYDIDTNLKNNPDKIRNFNKYLRENTTLLEVGGSFAKRSMTDKTDTEETKE